MNNKIESTTLKVRDVTSLFEFDSSFAKKKSPDASEAPIRMNKIRMQILKMMAPIFICSRNKSRQCNSITRIEFH